MHLNQFMVLWPFGSVTYDQPGIISMGFLKQEVLAFGNLLPMVSS